MIITIIAAIVISVPLLIISLYMAFLGKNARKIIKKYSDKDSMYINDIKISFQSFDIEANRNTFEEHKTQPDYSFNDCDILMTSDRLIILIKTKIFSKNRLVVPAIITGIHSEVSPPGHSKMVKCLDIRDRDTGLEIDFMNSPHKNLITVRFLNIDDELKNSIKEVLQ